MNDTCFALTKVGLKIVYVNSQLSGEICMT